MLYHQASTLQSGPIPHSHTAAVIFILPGLDWEDPINLDPGFFSEPNDVDIKMHIWAYKKMPTVMRSTDMYTGELLVGHPKFPDGSKAACVTDACSKSVVSDPDCTLEDDKAIEKYLRENVGSTWHSLSTLRWLRETRGALLIRNSTYIVINA